MMEIADTRNSHVVTTQTKLNVQSKARDVGLAFVQFWIHELG